MVVDGNEDGNDLVVTFRRMDARIISIIRSENLLTIRYILFPDLKTVYSAEFNICDNKIYPYQPRVQPRAQLEGG